MNVSSLVVRRFRALLTVFGLLLLAAGFIWWRLHARGGFLGTFEPDYLVTGVNSSARTMVLQKVDHRYIVRCMEYCSWFSVGKTYRMQNVVNGLEYKTRERKITLPILQEDVTFPNEGGRG
jgi:hypothetical protein